MQTMSNMHLSLDVWTATLLRHGLPGLRAKRQKTTATKGANKSAKDARAAQVRAAPSAFSEPPRRPPRLCRIAV